MDEAVKKRKYYAWTQEDLKKALKELKSKTLGLNECSRKYGVPKPTLRRHFTKSNKYSNDGEIYKGRPTVFTESVEKELVQHLLQMERYMFGLTISEVRRLAFQIAEKNNIKNNFNKEKQMAGKSWFYKFMRRHPELSVRQPESTSINRAKGFNKENVMDFFKKLEEIVDEKGITANNIFNVDETGISTVQKKPQKVIGEKGKKQVGVISSGERGVNTTAVCAASASGQYIPPMLIFKRKRMSPLLENGAPPGSVVTVSDTGYINSELFVKWMKHFINIVQQSLQKNVILLLDGHTTHTRNLEAIELARENGIIMLQLPGHTTHRLQPLDVSVFGPLSKYYSQSVETWLRVNSGKAVTQYEVSELFSQAYQKAATVGNAISGFKSAGVWPVNPYVFEDHHFLPSQTFENQSNANVEQIDNNDDIPCLSTNPIRVTDSISSDETDYENSCQSPSILDNREMEIIHIDTTTVAMTNKIKNPEKLSTLITRCVNTIFSKAKKGSSDYGFVSEQLEQKNHYDENDMANTKSVKPTKFDDKKKENALPSTYSEQHNIVNLKVPIIDISPIPNNKAVSKRRKGVQKTSILTSSPYKTELEESLQKRAAKIPKLVITEKRTTAKTIKDKKSSNQKKETKNATKTSKIAQTSGNPKSPASIVNYGASTSGTSTATKGRKPRFEESKTQNKITTKRPIKKKKVNKLIRDSSESSIEQISLDDSSEDLEEDLDNYCIMCNGYFYDKKGPKVDWIQCLRCHNWLHDTCSDNPNICPKCLE